MRKILLTLTLLLCMVSPALSTQFSDVTFGVNQIADTQWNVGACFYTSSCQIYSKWVGVTFESGSMYQLNSGQYVKFRSSGDSSLPWQMVLYNSDGSQNRIMGNGRILVQGQASDGNSYFFFDNCTCAGNGTLLSATVGMSGSSGVTFTGIYQPTVSQTNTAASNWTTTPLAPGQTAAPPAPVYSSSITSAEQARFNAAQTARQGIVGNSIDISNSGSNNAVYITQVGTNEKIGGQGQVAMPIIGSNNQITINQGDTISKQGQNLIQMNINGNWNTTNINQGLDVTGSSTGVDQGSHYQSISLNGDSNTVTTGQTGYKLYAEVNITGSYNNQTLSQSGTNHQAFTQISGNSNSMNTTQSGNGGHFLDVSLSGGGNGATVVQSGDTQNKATISITNAGGPASINLTQTGGQVFSIQQTCVTITGCGTTTVRQGN